MTKNGFLMMMLAATALSASTLNALIDKESSPSSSVEEQTIEEQTNTPIHLACASDDCLRESPDQPKKNGDAVPQLACLDPDCVLGSSKANNGVSDGE